MSSLLAVLLGVSLVVGFLRPRWWLALGPAVLAVGLIVYRLISTHRSRNADAVAFMGIVLFALAMVVALLLGALIRAGLERGRDRPAGAEAALRGARGIGFVGVGFLVTVVVIARFSREATAALAAAAVCVVLGRAWHARRRGARIRAITTSRTAAGPTRAGAPNPRAGTRRAPGATPISGATRRDRTRARRASARDPRP